MAPENYAVAARAEQSACAFARLAASMHIPLPRPPRSPGKAIVDAMLSCEVMSASALSPAELATWVGMMAGMPQLQRAFFAPGFARACETSHGRAYVAVLHESGTIRAFFPFQFASAWHQRLRLAERIGGELCDNAGLVAASGFAIGPQSLLRLCRLSGLFMTHLGPEQEALGLVGSEYEVGHQIDLSTGGAGYFAALSRDRRGFVQDTERRLRRAARDHGALQFHADMRPDRDAVRGLLAAKRHQYRRTGVADPFDAPERLRLIEVLTDMALPECQPLLTVLTAGDGVLAQHLGLLHAGVLSYWFPVYDASAAKVSPGRLLLWHTIQQAETLGIRLIDRGEGDSEAKRDFSTGTVRFGHANYFGRTVRSGIARAWQALQWRLQRQRIEVATG